MRLIDADALQEPVVELLGLAIKRVEDTPNDSPCYRMYVTQENERSRFIDLIDNAPTVDIKDIYQEGHYDGHLEGYTKAINEERPQGEWIRKEDVINSISKQYSEHNELVPIWLSIGEMKGGAV